MSPIARQGNGENQDVVRENCTQKDTSNVAFSNSEKGACMSYYVRQVNGKYGMETEILPKANLTEE